MATTISMYYDSSDYPTETVMVVYVDFEVTYPGNYDTEFVLYEDGVEIDTLYGSTFYLDAGGSKSNLKKTFSGLTPNTFYKIVVYLRNADNENRLKSDSVTFTTKEEELVAKVYYAKVILNGNGGDSDGSTTLTFDDPGWMSGWNGYADVPVDYDGSSFSRQGYRLLGFAESKGATDADYEISGRVFVYSSSINENKPASLTLYAVWTDARPANWEWKPAINQGSMVSITASHWNDFITRIQEFADFLSAPLSITTINDAQATKGAQMKASQAQAAVSLLEALNPPTSPPSNPSAGDVITAAFMNGLMYSLNSIKRS